MNEFNVNASPFVPEQAIQTDPGLLTPEEIEEFKNFLSSKQQNQNIDNLVIEMTDIVTDVINMLDDFCKATSDINDETLFADFENSFVNYNFWIFE